MPESDLKTQQHDAPQIAPSETWQQVAQPQYTQQNIQTGTQQDTWQQQQVYAGQNAQAQASHQQPYATPGYQVPQKEDNTTFILGIVSIVGVFVLRIASIILGIIAIVRANGEIKNNRETSKTRTGRTLGIVGIVLSIVFIIIESIVSILLLKAGISALQNFDYSGQFENLGMYFNNTLDTIDDYEIHFDKTHDIIEEERDVVGTWICTIGEVTTTYTFNDDHTGLHVATLGNKSDSSRASSDIKVNFTWKIVGYDRISIILGTDEQERTEQIAFFDDGFLNVDIFPSDASDEYLVHTKQSTPAL